MIVLTREEEVRPRRRSGRGRDIERHDGRWGVYIRDESRIGRQDGWRCEQRQTQTEEEGRPDSRDRPGGDYRSATVEYVRQQCDGRVE